MEIGWNLEVDKDNRAYFNNKQAYFLPILYLFAVYIHNVAYMSSLPLPMSK